MYHFCFPELETVTVPDLLKKMVIIYLTHYGKEFMSDGDTDFDGKIDLEIQNSKMK